MNGSIWRRIGVIGMVAGLTALVVAGVGLRPAQARSAYLTSFEATYPDAAGSRIAKCTLCHSGAPPQVNSYGMAYENAGNEFAPIESADSDGDGFTNLEEIVALTFPGNASDTPAAQPSPTPTATPVPTATNTPGGACVGDCNADGTVAIDELVKAVNIALGSVAVSVCPAADRNGNGEVSIDELLAAVNAALGGC